jgi:hypothetical protein
MRAVSEPENTPERNSRKIKKMRLMIIDKGSPLLAGSSTLVPPPKKYRLFFNNDKSFHGL